MCFYLRFGYGNKVLRFTKFMLIMSLVPIIFSFGVGAEAEYLQNETKNTKSVFIPEDEFVGFFDSDGIYNVVGAVKNNKNFTVTPIIDINIHDGPQIISKTFEYVPILSFNELPFKIKIPEVKTSDPVLEHSNVSYVIAEKKFPFVEVIYDDSLVQHEDGHLSGKIINNGNETVYNIKVFAIIHGMDHQTLDMGQNMKSIQKLLPGETQIFQMYPDPSIKSEIYYYSCFAITDSFVQPLQAERNDNKFYFRYDGGTWYTAPEFNEAGTELSMRTQNSFPLETYANFEFPKFSDEEKFEVFINGKKKESIQSIDEEGNWHVAFGVEPRESGSVLISGFEEGWDTGDKIYVPDWIRTNAFWWSNNQIDDQTFIKGIEFMIKEDIIRVTTESNVSENGSIPDWVKINAGWWSQEKITDETFVMGLKFLIDKGIIHV